MAKLIIGLILMTLCAISVKSQNCTMITFTKLSKLLPVFHPKSDDSAGDHSFQLLDFNTTCLSLSDIQYRYRYITLSTTYTVTTLFNGNNETFTALIDLGCSALTNDWDPEILGPDVSLTYNEPVSKDLLRIDCAKCISNTHPSSSINGTDSITHCQG